MLSCRGLRKDYLTERGGVSAVAGVDLEVAAGRFTAIIGRSGSGKSSLMAIPAVFVLARCPLPKLTGRAGCTSSGRIADLKPPVVHP